MKVVVNELSRSEFRLSQAALWRLVELGVPLRHPMTEIVDDGIVIHDNCLVAGMLASENPDDAETSPAWVHSDFRLYSTSFMFGEHMDDPRLVQVVEELGTDGAGTAATRPVVREV